MILSRTFIIEKDKWLNEQFNLSTLLYNQGRHFINEHYKKESINQYFNKELSKLKSERPLKGNKQDFNYNSFKIKNLSLKKRIKDYRYTT